MCFGLAQVRNYGELEVITLGSQIISVASHWEIEELQKRKLGETIARETFIAKGFLGIFDWDKLEKPSI